LRDHRRCRANAHPQSSGNGQCRNPTRSDEIVIAFADQKCGGGFDANKGKTGVNGRHREMTGRIDIKHGNTLIGSLRSTDGEPFAKDSAMT